MTREPRARRAARQACNNDLFYLCREYHVGIPTDKLDSILSANGFTMLEDGIYTGRDGHMLEAVGDGLYLSLTWHKMEVSGRYEIVAYVS